MCYLTPHRKKNPNNQNMQRKGNKREGKRKRVVREACLSRAAASLKKIKTLTFRPVFPQDCSKRRPALLLLQK